MSPADGCFSVMSTSGYAPVDVPVFGKRPHTGAGMSEMWSMISMSNSKHGKPKHQLSSRVQRGIRRTTIVFILVTSILGAVWGDSVVSYISLMLGWFSLVYPFVSSPSDKSVVENIEYMSAGKFNQICAGLDYWKSVSEKPAVLGSYNIESLQKKLLDNSTIDCSNDVVMVCLDLHESIEIHEIYGMYVAGSPVHIELSERDYIADIRTNQRKNVADDTPQTHQ